MTLHARIWAFATAAFVCWASSVTAGSTELKTTVTTYDYNPDGALSAVTVQVDDDMPTKTYLTWDHFTPDADDPTTGTVSAADGRLIGIGPNPGIDSATTTFEFDPRDRLLSYNGQNATEVYDYHADGMMSSSSVGADRRLFYYDSNADPHVTNIYQDQQGLWSSHLGRARFLDDGSEEIILSPRKDAACSYDTEGEMLQPYVYDVFGSTDEELSSSYDLRENSFRYANEYRDPIWGGYFLRGRWYHPDLPSFLSRDPHEHLNRYAYGAANPVMNVDPSGYSAKWYHGVEHFLRGIDSKLNRGVGGHFARIFLSPLLGPLQILAYPDQFWHSIKTDQGGIDVFLALGIASEVAGGFADSYFAGFAVSLGRRFAARAASDVAIGVGSSIAAGAHRGFHHFDWKSFGAGLELTAGSIVSRGLSGANVRSGFQLSGKDVAYLSEYLEDAPEGTALIFREKIKTPSVFVGNKQYGLTADSPFQQALHLGYYHERLIAITKDEILMNDSIDTGIRLGATEYDDLAAIVKKMKSAKGKFELVGRVEDFSASAKGRAAFLSNPHNAPIEVNETEIDEDDIRTRGGFKVNQYSALRNNCQHHAYAVLQDMGLR